MFYAIIALDSKDSLSKRMSYRPQHLARIQLLQNQGKLLLAGPFPAIDSMDPGQEGYTGSLIVAEFVSLKEAILWAHADPFFTSGVYASVDVKPFRKTLP
ncbi:MAG: YciI family protein [Candidatus Methylopumilus sp.]|nr:YciI family protein [Candidatus Methylopumilus sp.]